MSTRDFSFMPEMMDEQRELLAYLLEEIELPQKETIAPRERKGPVPLSFAQQRLWFLNQWESASVYNVPTAFRLTGPLNAPALLQSLNEIVRRHEILRTTFPAVEGGPVQRIAPALSLAIPIVDLADLPQAQREARAIELAAQEARCFFDLAQGPLLRATLFRLNDEAHVLLLVVHHIVSDGWSTGVLLREMSAIYCAFSSGAASPLPELITQYADFALWQREWLRGEVLEAQLTYWKAQLDGAPALLELPADHPRPPTQTSLGATYTFVLPQVLTKALQALSQREGVTLFMTLLAAFKTLLYRYTGRGDILVGSPIANRNRSEIEGLIGFFVNMLVLRTDLAGNPGFRALLRRVRGVALGAYAHQDLPFEKLVNELLPRRDLGHTPLFQVVFTLQNSLTPNLELPGVLAKPLEITWEKAHYDLSLSMQEVDGGLAGTLLYNTDLFDADRITRMAGHLRTLLEGIVADPERRVSELPILTAAERHQVLVEWNDSHADLTDAAVQRLVEARAVQAPDATAVAFRDQQLTYAQLNARANQLAHYLRGKNVGPDSVVALWDERTPEMVIALLGVLKAGGAYLPLDTHMPIDRISFILRDSRAAVLLTRDAMMQDMPFTWLLGLQDLRQDIVVTGPRLPIQDLDGLPFPDRSLVDYARYDRYNSSNGYVRQNISLVATRGCPYGCLYCHKLWPKKHVVRSADNIFREVLYHYERGYRTFTFWDDIFNLDCRNSEAFFQQVVKSNLKIRILFPNGMRGDILTPNYIDLMAEAGVVQMGVALETASPRLQRLICKNIKIEKLRENIDYICAKHPHIILDLLTMFGFPTETEEEALLTLDFIKSIRWLHFPVLSALKIFPNTDMARLAMEHGVPKEVIERSTHLAYHEPSDTLPFMKNFAREYQSRFLTEYFMSPERLKSVIPFQKQSLTREELVGRYDNYLPNGLQSYPEILRLIEGDDFYAQDVAPAAPIQISTGEGEAGEAPDQADGLRVLLLDLSQHFSSEATLLFDPVEAPLGLMHLMTYLNREFGDRLQGKILKSRVDFDSFGELRRALDDLEPQVVGIRTLSLYKDFFHKAVSLIKGWHPDIPIITGGPYATSEYATILSDSNVDLVVLGEGELTFSELIGEILAHDGALPEDDVLERISGLAFIPRRSAVAAQGREGCQVLLLDQIADEIALKENGNLTGPSQPDNLAYVIYTSGTTGRPKGVGIEQRGLLNLVFWHQQAFGVSAGDRATQVAGPAFDASVWELWPYLAAGASVHIVDDETRVSPERLRDWLLARGITISFLPTPLAESVLSLDWPGKAALRTLLTGGDRLHYPPSPGLPFVLINNYGPTEDSVVTTSGLVPPGEGAGRLPSIGRPIANTQVYLLDASLRPLPVGVSGELYVGGAGLARGYVNLPGLTAERFIPHLFSRVPGERLYRTGDLARYLPDGRIEFLGRVDHQVKIRGFRIELGEIETVLAQYSAVADAAVLVRQDTPTEDRRLVAFVVGESGCAPAGEDLCGHLRQKLPQYMIPAVFVTLDALPLTPNGKVDRRALASLDQTQTEPEREGIAPHTPDQDRLASIWGEVLGLERVGIHDNFFELGGHSLKATQLVSRMRDVFQVELSLHDLFRLPTVAQLAQALDAVRGRGAKSQEQVILPVAGERPGVVGSRDLSPLVAVQPSGSRPSLFCVHGGTGTIFPFFDLARRMGQDQPFYGLRATGLDGEGSPNVQIETMAACYVQGVREVQPSGPYYLGGWSMGGVVAFEMAQQLRQRGCSVALLALLDSWAPVSKDHIEPDDVTLTLWFVRDFFEQKLSVSCDDLLPLTPEARLDYILKKAKLAGLLSPDIQLFQMRRFWQVYQANIRATLDYRAQGYPDRITLFRAERPLIGMELYQEPTLGWDALTLGEIKIHTVSGDHYTMLNDFYVDVLAERLRGCIIKTHLSLARRTE